MRYTTNSKAISAKKSMIKAAIFLSIIVPRFVLAYYRYIIINEDTSSFSRKDSFYHRLDFIFKSGNFIINHIPNAVIIYTKIFMDYNIP